MRWASLLAVFAAAKLLVLWDRRIEWSAWTPIAYFWQDAAVALLFAVLDRFARRAWLGWTLYALAAGYAAMSVPIARAISSPLTWPMLRAVHGTLADSIIHYATWGNLAALLAMGAAAVGFPIVFYRAGADRWAAAPLALVPLAALGPFASARVESLGLERNPLAALALTAMPRVAATSVVRDWRASPFETIERDELSRYRGTCAGRNVILVVLESAAAVYLRPYGAAQDPMPNLTRLAGEGLLVENAYVVYPESIKGLFAVLTSTYPAFDTAPEEYERAGESSLATQLAGEGYRTGLFHSGRFMYLGMESIIRGRGFETLEDAGDIGGNHESSFGVDERATVERMLAWIDAGRQDRPFFITYLPIAGHHPYATPEPGPFGGGEEIDQYRNALDYADQALGDLLAGFGERGLER
ncbi:MAG: LTA synthase family protein, partial [Pirellulales bacterium]